MSLSKILKSTYDGIFNDATMKLGKRQLGSPSKEVAVLKSFTLKLFNQQSPVYPKDIFDSIDVN